MLFHDRKSVLTCPNTTSAYRPWNIRNITFAKHPAACSFLFAAEDCMKSHMVMRKLSRGDAFFAELPYPEPEFVSDLNNIFMSVGMEKASRILFCHYFARVKGHESQAFARNNVLFGWSSAGMLFIPVGSSHPFTQYYTSSQRPEPTEQTRDVQQKSQLPNAH